MTVLKVVPAAPAARAAKRVSADRWVLPYCRVRRPLLFVGARTSSPAELARDTVAAEKAAADVPREEQGRAALTELFEALKGEETPIIVDNVVNRIDEVVRAVRFEGWQSTIRGDQEVRQALRKTLYMQFRIRENDVFEKALGYVREYY
jgi:hypothetical protein